MLSLEQANSTSIHALNCTVIYTEPCKCKTNGILTIMKSWSVILAGIDHASKNNVC